MIFLIFMRLQNSSETQSTSLLTFPPLGDSCASMLQRQPAILFDPKETVQTYDSARLR